MDTTERFLKFAAECEVMAKFTRSPENRLVWNRMAERWLRCAQTLSQQDARLHERGNSERRRRRPSAIGSRGMAQ